MKYIHVGSDRLIPCKRIVGIFDADTATMGAATRGFLKEAQSGQRIVSATYELPRSFILTCDDMVTLSQISSKTLAGRAGGRPASRFESKDEKRDEKTKNESL